MDDDIKGGAWAVYGPQSGAILRGGTLVMDRPSFVIHLTAAGDVGHGRQRTRSWRAGGRQNVPGCLTGFTQVRSGWLAVQMGNGLTIKQQSFDQRDVTSSGSATAGSRAPNATASGTLPLSGGASATVAVQASAIGALGLTGTAAATAPAPAITATVTGVLPCLAVQAATVVTPAAMQRLRVHCRRRAMQRQRWQSLTVTRALVSQARRRQRWQARLLLQVHCPLQAMPAYKRHCGTSRRALDLTGTTTATNAIASTATGVLGLSGASVATVDNMR